MKNVSSLWVSHVKVIPPSLFPSLCPSLLPFLLSLPLIRAKVGVEMPNARCRV